MAITGCVESGVPAVPDIDGAVASTSIAPDPAEIPMFPPETDVTLTFDESAAEKAQLPAVSMAKTSNVATPPIVETVAPVTAADPHDNTMVSATSAVLPN